MSVDSLVKKAKKGDWDSYLDLVLEKKDLLYHKALTLLRNEFDAADAVEDSIIKGFEGLNRLEEPRYFHTWLVRILINTCIDIQRKNQKTVFLYEPREEADNLHLAEAADLRLDLQQQLDSMDPKYRTVLILRFFEDQTIEEIARVMGLPPGTVKSRLFYGLRKLRTNLEGVKQNEVQ